MQLRRLHRLTSTDLGMDWDDGHKGIISLRRLRDSCPCASCSGETILLRSAPPQEQDYETAGRYDLRAASVVGNYAVQFTWGDGHSQGIYTWEHLRGICQCEQCRGADTKEGEHS